MLIEKLPTPRVGLLVRCKDTEAEAGRGTTNHRTSSSCFLLQKMMMITDDKTKAPVFETLLLPCHKSSSHLPSASVVPVSKFIFMIPNFLSRKSSPFVTMHSMNGPSHHTSFTNKAITIQQEQKQHDSWATGGEGKKKTTTTWRDVTITEILKNITTHYSGIYGWRILLPR